jgi:DNA-binding NtrC family response regulator
MPTIVVIEDELPILDLIGEMLEMDGYDVIAVSHPGEVEQAVAGRNPSLFLTDIMLQGKSGIEVAQELRERSFDRTPMVAMSASKTMIQFAMTSGLFQAAIEKPFDLDALLNLVKRTLQQSELPTATSAV